MPPLFIKESVNDMTIRPYRYGEDFEAVASFMSDERAHALWCANIFRYPLAQAGFELKLRELYAASGDEAFIALDDDGAAVGFFCLSGKDEQGAVMLKFVILSPQLRGRGFGRQMLKLAVAQAFEKGAAAVTLSVFSVNDKARRCYIAAGFEEKPVTAGSFAWGGEIWGRSVLEIKK